MGTAQASDYLETALLNHLFRSAPFAKPTGLYLALYTAAPSDAGGGTEVAGGGYARVNLPPLDTNWRAPAGGTTTNAVPITFPTASANWGMVSHYGIFDAPAGGNLLIWDALTTPRTVNAGDPAAAFPVGDLHITVA